MYEHRETITTGKLRMRANNQLQREIKKVYKFHNKKAFEHANTSRLNNVEQTTDPFLINAVILSTLFTLFLSTHLVILLTIISRYEIECVQYRSLIRKQQLDTLRVEKKKIIIYLLFILSARLPTNQL